jgi:hypothetical protein
LNKEIKPMNTDKATPELFNALAEAQGEIENAEKNSVNPHFKSRYADLAEILNTIRPVFSKHGLSVVQSPTFDGNLAKVTTMVAHKAGGFLIDTASCVPAKTDGQGIGAATTYLRRYAVAAFAGIAQEDDDGESAKHDTRTPATRQEAQPTASQRPAAPARQEPRQAPTTSPAKGGAPQFATLDRPRILAGATITESHELTGTNARGDWTAWKFLVNHEGQVYNVGTFKQEIASVALANVDPNGTIQVDIDVKPLANGKIELVSVQNADDVPV